jgi:preprotein translocase subunit YajC
LKLYRTIITGLIIVLITAALFFSGCVVGEGEDGESTGGFESYIPLIVLAVLMIAMFYFLMIRPVRQREQKHDQLVQALQRGDKVVTAGGMYGEVDSVDEDSVVIIVESGAKIRVAKGGVISKPDQYETR